MTAAAILLAGGESTRMGSPKPLLEWAGTTLIEYQLRQLQQAGIDRTIVVLGHRADDVRPYVRRAGALSVINELYSEGRASSLRVGAATLGEDVQLVLILNVDQPRPAAVSARLLAEHRAGGHLITVPIFEGRRGHPPVLYGTLIPELRELREATLGLRALMDRHETEISEVPFDTPVVLLDVNDPAEYERAKASFARASEGA